MVINTSAKIFRLRPHTNAKIEKRFKARFHIQSHSLHQPFITLPNLQVQVLIGAKVYKTEQYHQLILSPSRCLSKSQKRISARAQYVDLNSAWEVILAYQNFAENPQDPYHFDLAQSSVPRKSLL